MPGRSKAVRVRNRRRLAAQKASCHICGDTIDYELPYLDPGEFVVDHVIPLNRGGTDTPDNTAAAHRACNRAKSDKPYAPIVKRSGSLA